MTSGGFVQRHKMAVYEYLTVKGKKGTAVPVTGREGP
jgi:hypothetical protein